METWCPECVHVQEALGTQYSQHPSTGEGSNPTSVASAYPTHTQETSQGSLWSYASKVLRVTLYCVEMTDMFISSALLFVHCSIVCADNLLKRVSVLQTLMQMCPHCEPPPRLETEEIILTFNICMTFVWGTVCATFRQRQRTCLVQKDNISLTGHNLQT